MDSHSGNVQINNLVLQGIGADARAQMSAAFEELHLEHGRVLYQAEDTIDYLYFPEDSMISVVTTTRAGQTAEAGVIGFEGFSGLEGLLYGGPSFNLHIVQLAGRAHRVRKDEIKREFDRGGDVQKAALRFTRALMSQFSQTALCNRIHTAEKRLAKWLLSCHDRAPGDVMYLTQEFIATMLGANRTSVTVAAGELQDAGYIDYRRGKITMLDRDGLESYSCECYARIRKEYASLT